MVRYPTKRALPTPVHAQVLVTARCNARCSQCNIWQRYVENPRLAEEELSTEELMDLGLQLAEMGVRSVSISGGEPFMRRDLFRFVRVLKEKKIWVNVTTNGSLLNEKNRQIIIQAGLDSLTVSIDGTEKVHAKLRGGFSFQEIFSNLRELASLRERVGNGVPSLNVASVITGENVESVIELNRTVGRESSRINHSFESLISFAELFGLDRRKENVRDLRVDEAQMDWLLAHLPRDKDRFTYWLMKKYNAGKISFPSLFHPCLAGLFNIVVSETGNVLPCCTWSEGGVVGNVRERPLSWIWESPEFAEKRREIRKGLCPGCWISTYVQNSVPIWPESIARKLGKRAGIGQHSLHSS